MDTIQKELKTTNSTTVVCEKSDANLEKNNSKNLTTT